MHLIIAVLTSPTHGLQGAALVCHLATYGVLGDVVNTSQSGPPPPPPPPPLPLPPPLQGQVHGFTLEEVGWPGEASPGAWRLHWSRLYLRGAWCALVAARYRN